MKNSWIRRWLGVVLGYIKLSRIRFFPQFNLFWSMFQVGPNIHRLRHKYFIIASIRRIITFAQFQYTTTLSRTGFVFPGVPKAATVEKVLCKTTNDLRPPREGKVVETNIRTCPVRGQKEILSLIRLTKNETTNIEHVSIVLFAKLFMRVLE